MPKSVRNSTGSTITVADVGGVQIAAGATYAIPPQDFLLWAASSTAATKVTAGDLVVNNSLEDLNAADGLLCLQMTFTTADATLAALSTYDTNGLMTQTATNTFTGRTIVGTTNQVNVSNGSGVAGNPTLSTPQDIHTGATPTFVSATLTGVTASRAVVTTAGQVLDESATTATELGYVSGVTSAIQTQIDGKQATGDYITALTGDVTAAGPGSAAATIANDAVTYAKIQDVTATDRLLGRASSGSGIIEEITCTSFARTVLDDTTAAAARTTLGAGDVTGPASSTDNGIVRFDGTTGKIVQGSNPACTISDGGVLSAGFLVTTAYSTIPATRVAFLGTSGGIESLTPVRTKTELDSLCGDNLPAAVGATTSYGFLYRSPSVGWTHLAAGTAGQVLTTQGTGADPTWTAPSAGTTQYMHLYANVAGGNTINYSSGSWADIHNVLTTLTTGESAGITRSNSTLTIGATGLYYINMLATAYQSAYIMFRIRKTNGTPATILKQVGYAAGTSQSAPSGLNGIVSLTASDTISIQYVVSATGGFGTADLDSETDGMFNFSIFKIA